LIDLEQKISKLESEPEIRQELKQQAIDISTSAGIMCAFTSFVAVLPHPPSKIPIFLRGSDGHVCALRVDPRTSISDLRSLVCWETGVVPSDQILLHEGKTLQSGTLLDHSVREKSTIVVSAAASTGANPVKSGYLEYPGNVGYPRRCGMQLFVRHLDGRVYELQVCPDSSITEVKATINRQLGVSCDEQCLIYQGKPLVSGTLLDYSIQKTCTIQLVKAVRGGGFGALVISDIDAPHKENDISDLLTGHSVDGCWLDAGAMQRLAGLRNLPTVPDLPPEVASKARATLIALALLRKYHSDEYELWRLLELKAIQWLNRVRAGASWSKIINELMAALR
jgi:hypothetical protein